MKKYLNILVYLVYFSTPFESVGVGHGISVVKIITAFVLIFALFNLKVFKIPKIRFFLFFLAYMIWTIFSSLWSIDPAITLRYSLGMILPTFLSTIVIFNLIHSKKQIENIFKSYALGSIIVSIIALYMFATGFRFANELDYARVTVLGQDQNELSFLLSFGIVSIIYLLKFTKQKRGVKFVFFASTFVLAFTVLSTGSRTGFVILLTIVTVVIIMLIKKGRIVYFLPIIVGAGILMYMYLPGMVTNRLFQTTQQIKTENLTGRVVIWQMGWSAFNQEKAYLFGTGFHAFRELMNSYYQWPKAPHNTYLSTMIGLGIIGFLIYSVMIICLLQKVFFLVKNHSQYFILLILPLLLAMFTLGLETRRWLYLLAVLIIRIFQLLRAEDAKKQISMN